MAKVVACAAMALARAVVSALVSRCGYINNGSAATRRRTSWGLYQSVSVGRVCRRGTSLPLCSNLALQDCIASYLKKTKYSQDRCTGFPCPAVMPTSGKPCPGERHYLAICYPELLGVYR